MPAEDRKAAVATFPLVGPGMSEIAALVATVRRLAIARSMPEVMHITTQAARTLLLADGITFVLREGDFCYYAEEDAISPLWKGQRFPMSACISGWCMLEAKPAVIPDIYKDDRIPKDAYRPTFVRSLAMVPVRQEAPIAAMGAYWSRVKNPTPAEIELLQTIANAAALAIAFVELQRQYAAAAAHSLVRDGDVAAVWDRNNVLTISGRAFAQGFDLANAVARALDGRIYYWSSNMERLYGWSRGEAVGQVSHELLKTQFPVRLEQIEGELLETGEWNGELTHSTRDGREIVVASHWAVLRDDAGQPVSVIEVNNDITAVKATEVALRRAKQEAEENARAKSRLLAAVGHDLKQPLTVIRMVLSGLEAKVDASEQKNLARADRSSEYLASALDTLLEASQLESGAVKPRVTTFPISSLLDAVREEFALIAGEKGLNFHVATCDAWVCSDAKMLGSILRNLVSNAMRYTEQGTVGIGCEVHDNTLSVQVRDTGIGIPEDRMDFIFEEFQRIDPSKGAGLGLGLAIVRRAAEALGHAVTVRSTLDTGSVFRVDVPIAA